MSELQVRADALVIRYQDLLNLFDWDIKIFIMGEASYAKKHGKRYSAITNGCADIYQTKKRAKIYVKDDLDEETFVNCIIHELVHIPLNDLYVTGLSCLWELEESEFKTQTCMNWEWILEAAVCRITSGFDKMEVEDAQMSQVQGDISSAS